ncbi:four-jointed box protein 1-like [Tubulanus polymorphus]|uniref:four-jointed box protein 1-like n=1 Tax=Tubulanus polymorphus TaxID=672921 RepID=UPI003DA6C98D
MASCSTFHLYRRKKCLLIAFSIFGIIVLVLHLHGRTGDIILKAAKDRVLPLAAGSSRNGRLPRRMKSHVAGYNLEFDEDEYDDGELYVAAARASDSNPGAIEHKPVQLIKVSAIQQRRRSSSSNSALKFHPESDDDYDSDLNTLGIGDPDIGDEDDDDDDDEDYANPNRPFKEGDFAPAKPDDKPARTMSYEEVEQPRRDGTAKHSNGKNSSKLPSSSETNHKGARVILNNANRMDEFVPSRIVTPRKYTNVTVYTSKGIPLVEEKIFWTKELEDSIPSGYTDTNEIQLVTNKMRRNSVYKILPALWNRCGGPNNKYLVLHGRIEVCARNRSPHDKLIAGELLSFHLSQLLGLNNVPAVVLSYVNPAKPNSQWYKRNLTAISWQPGKLVAFIHWINNLNTDESQVKIPGILLQAYEQSEPLDFRSSSLANTTWTTLVQVAQWTDLILFDYITANYDRIASMQDGAYLQNRPSIMHESIRNLRRSADTGSLWFFDNESGLLDAYELINQPRSQFPSFHRRMLRSVCIFRKSTVERLAWLATMDKPVQYLLQYTRRREPLTASLMPVIDAHEYFHKDFRERIQDVHSWITSCKNRK